MRENVDTKKITNEGDINTASTTNIRHDGEKKHKRKGSYLKSNKELLLDHELTKI